MKADPNEGNTALPPEVEWRFKDQIEILGAAHQKKIHAATALLLDASPLALKTAKKLASLGFGAVGILGDQGATSSHEIIRKEELEKSSIQGLREWAKREAPITHIETYKELSIERRFEDVEKGFSCFVFCSVQAIEAYSEATLHNKKDTFFALASGSKAFLGMVPKEALNPSIFGSIQRRAQPLTKSAGANLALLDWTAARLAILLQDYFSAGKAPQTFFDITDTSTSPWKTEPLTL